VLDTLLSVDLNEFLTFEYLPKFSVESTLGFAAIGVALSLTTLPTHLDIQIRRASTGDQGPLALVRANDLAKNLLFAGAFFMVAAVYAYFEIGGHRWRTYTAVMSCIGVATVGYAYLSYLMRCTLLDWTVAVMVWLASRMQGARQPAVVGAAAAPGTA